MRKKYLSALLFGALLVASTGTFTSCKDYDDDINNLQEQINGQEKTLTEKLTAVEKSITDLQAAQTTMQTDIANAQKAVQEAQAAADAAAQAAAEAKLAATEAQANAIAEAAKQLEAAKAELTELIQKGDQALQAEIDAANAEIAKVQGAVQALQAWQGTTEETLKNLADADAALQTSLEGVQAELVDLANRVGKLEAGLAAQEDALEGFEGDLTSVEGELATLKEAVEKLAGLDPEDLVQMDKDITALEGQVGALSNSISEINDNLNILYIAVYKGITSVSLVDGTVIETGRKYSANLLKLLSDIAVKDYTFGSKMYGDVEIRHMPADKYMPNGELEGAVKFEKGTRQKQTARALIRVSPANTFITKYDIHLIDSEGNDLVNNGLVKVTGVKRLEGSLAAPVSRADATTPYKTGLVEVEFQVGDKADDKDYDFDGEFYKAVTAENAQGVREAKGFAIQISQYTEIPETGEGTQSEAFMRDVVSAYSLNLMPTDKNVDASELEFSLYKEGRKDEKSVTEINNRWTGNSNEDNGPVEYAWKENKVSADLIYTGSNATVVRDANDNRSTAPNKKEAYSVKSGEKFFVDLSEMNESDKNVKYFYIVLDRDYVNKTNDQDSELVAWDSYESKIKGINKVYTIEDPENAIAEMEINIDYTDVIGFRVYAANADGSLVDPDGKAFYVQVGEAAATMEAKAEITASADVDKAGNTVMKSDFISVNELGEWDKLLAAAKASKNGTLEVELDTKMKEAIGGDNGHLDDATKLSGNVFSVEYYKDDIEGDDTKKIADNDLSKDNLKDVKYIKLVFNVTADKLVDEHTYTGKVTFKLANTSGDAGSTSTIGVMNLEAKKVMPKSLPEGFSAKVNQIVDGKYLCYVLPSVDAALPKDGKVDGTISLYQSFNMMTDFQEWKDGKPVYKLDNKYIFTFKDAAFDSKDALIDLIVKGYNLKVDNKFINSHDSETSYTTSVEYNYGEISYVYDEVTNKFVVKNWTVKGEDFQTQFKCISSAQSWAWDKEATFDFVETDSKKDDYHTTAQLTYGQTYEYQHRITTLLGTNKYDNTTYGGNFVDFFEDANMINGGTIRLGSLKQKVKVELISNDGEVNEYFTPVFAQQAGYTICINFTPNKTTVSAPQADVPSTLRLTMEDVFGHETVVELPMNVHVDKGE